MKLLQIAVTTPLLLFSNVAFAQALLETDPLAAGSNWMQPDQTAIVLANQPNTGGTEGVISSVYSASPGNPITLVMMDFDVPAGRNVRLSRIDADGFVSVNSPAVSASAGVEYFVCSNTVDNLPACANPDQTTGRLWRYLAPIGSPGLTIGGADSSDPSLNLVAANQMVPLTPGKYWLGVAVRWNATDPGANAINGRWNWIQAGTGGIFFGRVSHLFAPALFNVNTWTPFVVLGFNSQDSAARIEALPFDASTVVSSPVPVDSRLAVGVLSLLLLAAGIAATHSYARASDLV